VFVAAGACSSTQTQAPSPRKRQGGDGRASRRVAVTAVGAPGAALPALPPLRASCLFAGIGARVVSVRLSLCLGED